MEPNSKTTWDELAQSFASSRLISADKLIEWPAQLRLVGPFVNKRVLDVGCGTGEKASYFAEHGADSVVAVDPSEGFLAEWQTRKGPRLHFEHADFDSLQRVVEQPQFDIVICFQALMYATDLRAAVRTMRDLLAPGGRLVVSIPHPFRFAILRNEREGWPLGKAYQETSLYRYPSPWKAEVQLEHAMPRISDYLNAFSDARLVLERCEEPIVTDEFRESAPEKAAWMDRYIGTIVFSLQLRPE